MRDGLQFAVRNVQAGAEVRKALSRVCKSGGVFDVFDRIRMQEQHYFLYVDIAY